MISSLTAKDISFFYTKKNPILQHVNMQFSKGSITAIVGMNGSGKTTLLNMLSGIFPPKDGYIAYNDQQLVKKNLVNYKKNLGFMPESLTLYPEETVYSVLLFLAKLRGNAEGTDVSKEKISHERILEIIEKVGLKDHMHKKISALSKGLKQRVNFAQSILHAPAVAIFDEPSNGFDYLGVRMFYDTLQELKAHGTIIILTSHIFEELLNKVDRILFLQDGTLNKEIDLQKNKNLKTSTKGEDTLIFISFVLNKNIEEEDLNKFHTMNLAIHYEDKKTLEGNIYDSMFLDILELIQTQGYSITAIHIIPTNLETLI